MSNRIEIKTNSPLRILCVGDVHAPYTSAKALDNVLMLAKDVKPTHIVQIGDLYDQYVYSRYAKSLNLKTPKQEDKEGRAVGEYLWSELRRFAPGAQRFQMRGNHCIRMKKRILERAPEFEEAVDDYLTKMFTFKGVTTLADDRSELVLNDILFIHGYLANAGDHLRANRRSTVVGHSHRGGAVFARYGDKTLFELNCGHIADDSLLPFAYTPQRTTFWTPGVGLLETRRGIVVPSFVAF